LKPLEGITVIELSTMITASFATMMMAEQGARVIKVEPLEVGDPMRYFGSGKGGISSLFANCNRGKHSIRVDIKGEAGQSLIREMIREVDVLIHNFRPGVMEKLNLDSNTLRTINPDLIYMGISGFGKEGGLGRAPAYDTIIQARAGFTDTQGFDGEPVFFRTFICDKITAYTACQAVTCALFHRERTGKGQHIDLSMLDASLFFIFPDGFQNHTLLDEDASKQPLTIDLVFRLTMTKDGAVTVAAATQDMQMRSLIALGVEHLLADERFNSSDKRIANRDEFEALVKAAYLQYTTDEVIEKLQEADVPCARCLSKEEVLAQEQLWTNSSIEVVDHPLMGRMQVVKSPARFSGERLPPSRPSPDHGEHTREVLETFAIDEDRIQLLMQAGAIR
jgi:crotonobetainyl-CoA:carnitine CoA-transferase CaiB-like acyl-CoA transferase